MKNAPKSITSEMMKSSIPRNCASTRDETFGRGRAVVVVLVGDVRLRSRRIPSARLTTCSTGLPVEASTRPIRSLRSQPERVSGKVEMTMSSGA